MNSYLLLFCLKNAQLKVVQSIILLKSISPLFWATNLHWRNLKWKLFNDIEAKSCYCQRHDRGFPLYIVVRHIGPTNVEFKGSSSTRVHSGRLLFFVCLFVFLFFFWLSGKITAVHEDAQFEKMHPEQFVGSLTCINVTPFIKESSRIKGFFFSSQKVIANRRSACKVHWLRWTLPLH